MDALRVQLRNWGLPEHLVGREPDSRKASRKVVDSNPPEEERRAKGTDLEPVKLPAAGRALELFEDMVDDLRAELGALKHRMEYLKDGRFIVGPGWLLFRSIPREKATEEMPEDASILWHEDSSTDDLPDDLRSLVEARVLGPQEQGYNEGMLPEARGGSPVPPEPLASLCALYVLRGGDPEDLVKVLHPDPEAAPIEKLKGTDGKKGVARRLREEARRLAAMVRGKNEIGGRNRKDISSTEHAVARYITRQRRKGVDDARILEELREGAVGDAPTGIDQKEFDRLRDLRLD